MTNSSAHRQHPIAVRLRKLRADRHLTLREVAARCGGDMDEQQVSRLEHGQRLPSIDTLVRLARGLDCKVVDIVSCLDEADTKQASDREANALGGASADHEDARCARADGPWPAARAYRLSTSTSVEKL